MIRRLSFLVLVLALTFSIGCGSDAEKIEQFLARGDDYAAEKKYSEAILEYKNAIQIDPNQSAAHWGLAKAHIGNGQEREGLWELQETVRLDPSNKDARLQLGNLLLRTGNLDEGLEQAIQVLALDSTNARAGLLRAQALEAQKKFDEAAAAYRSALQWAAGKPDEPAALRLIAGFHTRRGDPASAAPYYEKLVELAPTSAHLVTLGDHHRRDAKPEKAEAAYRRAVEAATKPRETTRAYSVLAIFLYEQDRVAEGVQVLQKGIASTEAPLDLTYLLARFYNMQGADELADRLVRDLAAGTQDDARPYVVLSSYEQGRGRLAEALAAVDRALEIEPENREAQIWRAELLVDLGQKENSPDRYVQAGKAIEAVLKKSHGYADALVAKAKVDMVQARPKDALEALATAIQARPNWAVPHFRSGSVHALLGEWSLARTELARAVELDATMVEARRLLVRAHQELGEHEYAIEVARKYLRERPDDTETRTRLAQSLYSLDRPREAAEALAPIPEDLRTPEVRFALAQLAVAAGRTDEARAMLISALADRPDSPEVLQSLLNLDVREKKLDQSVERIRAALGAHPENPRLHQLRGVAALAAGDSAAAEAAFRRAVELDPTAAGTSQQLAEFYVHDGRELEAIRTYEAAIAKNDRDPQLPFMVAILYERAGNLDSAIASYERAIELNPNLAEAMNNLAFLLADSGRELDRALELAQQARELLPDDPTTADTLGWVFFKRKLPQAAIEHLRDAEAGRKAGDPERGAVRHHLALAYEADGKQAAAIDVARRALLELDGVRRAAQKKSQPVAPEPKWAAELRALVERGGTGAETSTSATAGGPKGA